MRNNKVYLPALLAVAVTLPGCSWIDNAVAWVEDDLGQQPAVAAEPLGFIPKENYPHRDHSYDGYLPPSAGLQPWQLEKLFFDVAMPQSHGAMVSFLGYPVAEDGHYSYWKIDGSSSELAVYYKDGTALNYTVGY